MLGLELQQFHSSIAIFLSPVYDAIFFSPVGKKGCLRKH